MSDEEKKMFVGKKIKSIYVDGSEIDLILEDDIELIYNATDGGYSSYEIIRNTNETIDCLEEE